MPPDFVEPQPSDIILRGIRDPESPSVPHRINPLSQDNLIGDVNLAVQSLVPLLPSGSRTRQLWAVLHVLICCVVQDACCV